MKTEPKTFDLQPALFPNQFEGAWNRPPRKMGPVFWTDQIENTREV